MKVIIQRAALLKPLQMIGGVVEKRQTMPILANVLLMVKEQQLILVGTDLEIEMIGNAPLDEVVELGAVTVSAKKLLDICRTLPENASLELYLENGHLIVRSGKSRFMLATLPVEDFPKIEEIKFTTEFKIGQAQFKKLLNKTYFAMGQQDVRHYLNGALFDVNQGVVKCVATDGHRLAFSSAANDPDLAVQTKVILPRKSVLELIRLLDINSSEDPTICVGDNHFRLVLPEFTLTSKLINAQYPDYNRLIPGSTTQSLVANREMLKQALTRASILLNEKFRGVRLQLEQGLMRITANNPEQEEAVELVQLEYQGSELEFGFNAAYLLDVVSSITSEFVQWSFTDSNGGVLIEASDKDDCLYVVMPLRM